MPVGWDKQIELGKKVKRNREIVQRSQLIGSPSNYLVSLISDVSTCTSMSYSLRVPVL